MENKQKLKRNDLVKNFVDNYITENDLSFCHVIQQKWHEMLNDMFEAETITHGTFIANSRIDPFTSFTIDYRIEKFHKFKGDNYV